MVLELKRIVVPNTKPINHKVLIPELLIAGISYGSTDSIKQYYRKNLLVQWHHSIHPHKCTIEQHHHPHTIHSIENHQRIEHSIDCYPNIEHFIKYYPHTVHFKLLL